MRKSFFAVLVSTAVVLAGCGSDTEGAQQDQEPQRGGTLAQAIVRPASLDPARASTVSERIVADYLYDGLTSTNARSFATEPALATSWESTDESSHWTFTLTDATASDGEPVVAEDVKRSFQRVVRADSAATPLLSVIDGFEEFAGNGDSSDLEGIVVVDDSTVRFELSGPYAEFPALVANPAFGVMRFDGDERISTGPMRLEDRDDNVLRLVRTEDSQAYLDGVELRLFRNVSAAFEALQRGDVQWAQVPDGDAEEMGQRFGSNLYRDSLRTQFIAFNTENEKLRDPRFREAITRAIDRGAVLDKLGAADAELLNGVVPDGVPGAQNGGCGVKCNHDPQAAEALIEQVFPEGNIPTLNLDFPEGPPFDDPAVEQIVADLNEVGIELNPRPVNPDDYAARTAADDRELFLASWSAPYPSADAFVPQLFESSSPSNVFELDDDGIDQKVEQARQEEGGDVRTRLLQEAERDVMARMPLIPLAQFPISSVAASEVRGIDPLPTGNFNIESVWLRSDPQ